MKEEFEYQFQIFHLTVEIVSPVDVKMRLKEKFTQNIYTSVHKMKKFSTKVLKRFFYPLDQEYTHIFEKITNDQSTYCIIKLVTSIPLLKNITESIILVPHSKKQIAAKQKKTVPAIQKIKNIKKPRLFFEMKNQLCFVSPDFYSIEYNEEEAQQFSAIIEIAFQEQGRYLLQLSFFIQSSKQFFFLHRNQSYTQQLAPHSSFLLTNSTHYQPFKISTVIDVNTRENMRHSFELGNTYDYPCKLRNIVLTARKI